jgi:gluconolactonase
VGFSCKEWVKNLFRALWRKPDAGITHKRPGAPDGMKVDQQGNIYSAGPGGVLVFSPSGKHLGSFLLPTKTSNVNWGDSDAKTLYVTSSGNIYRIRLTIPGVQP